jgi:hypothetical protein
MGVCGVVWYGVVWCGVRAAVTKGGERLYHHFCGKKGNEVIRETLERGFLEIHFMHLH